MKSFDFLRKWHPRSFWSVSGKKIFAWRPKKEDFVKRPSLVLYVFLILIFLISQFSIFSKASEAAEITKSSTADWNQGTNSNVSTASDELKLSTTYSSWYDANWKYRRKITIDYTKVSADQTDFPVLVKITGAIDPIFANAQADGDDILFTSSNETSKLSHDLEKFDASTKDFYAWVKVPALSSSANTVLYLYYGNADAVSQEDKSVTWSGHTAVWHMDEAAWVNGVADVIDAKGSYNGTSASSAATTSGGIYREGSFNGDLSQVNTSMSSPDSFTVEAWAKLDAATGNYQAISVINPSMSGGSPWQFGVVGTNLQGRVSRVGADGTIANAAITLGARYHFALTYDSATDTATQWINGVSAGTVSVAGDAKATTSHRIGNTDGQSTRTWNGKIDELKVSSSPRDSSWLATEYKNLNNPEGFAVVGDELASYASWYNASWNYRKPVTIDKTKVSTVNGVGLTDFPIMVNLPSDTDLAADALDNGYDLLFTLGDGKTKLSHEIESFNGSTGALVAWIKMPVLTKADNKVIYLYYGNSGAANQQNVNDVWSNSYASVWHLQEATNAQALDSTSYAKNSTTNSATQIEGKIGYGQSLVKASSNSIIFPSVLSGADYTISGWVKVAASDYGIILECRGGGSNGALLYTIITTGKAGSFFNPPSDQALSTATAADNTWHYVVGTRSGNTMSVYVDNNTVITKTITAWTTWGTDARIGKDTANIYYSSSNDEARTSTVARSADWVATEYNNQNSPATFYALGGEETGVGRYSSPTSTTGGSGILDTYYNLDWGAPNGFAANVTIPANTSIILSARSSAVGGSSDGDWTGWQALGTASSTGTFSVTHDNMPVGLTTGANHYLQLKASLSTTDGLSTPTLSDYTFYYIADVDAPTNPTTTTATLGGNPLTSGTWTNTAGTVNFTFSGATDSETGVAGYYTYLGTSAVGDPSTYQAHIGAGGNNQTFSSAIADGSNYYFRIETKDGASNISSAATLFTIGCDTTAPTKPSYITADPAGYTSTNSFDFSWPAGSDNTSGIQYYEYKRATDPTWTQTAGPNDRSALDLEAYQEGANGFYVRTVDNADNPSSTYTQVAYYWSGEAPPKPDNVAVDPASNDENSFTISWDKPDVGAGSPIVGYYFSINTPPTLTNSTYVASTASQVSVGPDKYATIQGENTVYVVSKDEAGNSSFLPAYYSTATFNCQTAAPPTPTSVSIYDSSDKVEPRYMLTVQWQAGVGQDATTFDHYSVERSTNGTDYSELATVSDGTSYLDDSSLSDQTTYYYRIKSVDNAGSSSAASSVVSKKPSGKYTTPPTIIAGPEVERKATQATITWTTNRASSSFVRYGTDENSLEESKGDFENTTNHSVALLGLSGSTRYYFQVQSVDTERDYTLESAYSTTYSFVTLVKPSISNVAVSSITLSSADISWDTTTVASSRLNYGKTTSYGTTIEDVSGQSSTKHSTKIINLDNSTLYHFKIVSTDTDGIELTSDDYSFETLPMPKISNLKIEEITGRPSQVIKINWETNVETSTVLEYSAGGEKTKERVSSKLEKNHEVEVDGLSDDSAYSIIAKGTDQFGNVAISETQTFKTKFDTRKANISDIQVESSNIGQIQSGTSQMVISCKTDEPTTAQVLYGEGLSGETTAKTIEDTELKTNHLAIVTGLKSNAAYSFKIVVKDKAGNETVSSNQITVVGEARTSAIKKIFDALNNLFGKWIKM